MHEFTDPPFPKAPHASKCKHKVTSVAGHVFSVDFHAKYQSWDAVDPAELFTAPIVKKATSGGVIKNLEAAARGANFIVLWMDCDRYVLCNNDDAGDDNHDVYVVTTVYSSH